MKLVFTCGVFDLLHEGHIELFNQMNELGDITLAIVHDGFTTFENKKKLPIENLEKRTRNIIDTGLIDVIRHTFEKEPDNTFKTVIERYKDKFELIFMRGDDWSEFPGVRTLRENNIPIVYKKYKESISSSKLRNEL